MQPLNKTATVGELDDLLVDLCDRYGFNPVPKLQWSTRMVKTLGMAFPTKNIIRLSAWLNPEQAESTLRHELAHIATGKSDARHPHGPQWKKWAIELGAPPVRASSQGPANAPARNATHSLWGLECPKCGLRLARKRVKKGLYHRGCGPRAGSLIRSVRGTAERVYSWVLGTFDGNNEIS